MSELPGAGTRRATLADLDEAAAVLGAAFADSPWTRWTVDPDHHVARITALQRLTIEWLGLPFGEVWVSTVDDAIACVALWADSAVTLPDEVGHRLSTASAEWEGSRREASALAEAQVAGWRPAKRHLFLGTVGTRPEWQGRGLARRTLAPTLAHADATGITAFLETSSASNVALYASLGFDVVGHVMIDGGGPDVWAMLRRPRPD